MPGSTLFNQLIEFIESSSKILMKSVPAEARFFKKKITVLIEIVKKSQAHSKQIHRF